MSGYIPKKGRTGSLLTPPVLIAVLCGCGDFFLHKPVEPQSKSIIEDLGRIRELPDINTPVPDIHLAEPRILEDKHGVKLFYFTRHHAVDKLAKLVTEQLSHQVSQSPATNRLIVKCPSVEDAEATIRFLNEVDVPPIQVRIDCLISEVYADRTLELGNHAGDFRFSW